MPSDTFKYIPVGRLPAPGTCCICGSDQRDCIDFKFTAEYYGAVLICVACIQDITQVEELAIVSEATIFDLKMRVASSAHRDEVLKAAGKEIKDDLVAVADRVNDIIYNYHTHFVADTSESEPSFDDLLRERSKAE